MNHQINKSKIANLSEATFPLTRTNIWIELEFQWICNENLRNFQCLRTSCWPPTFKLILWKCQKSAPKHTQKNSFTFCKWEKMIITTQFTKAPGSHYRRIRFQFIQNSHFVPLGLLRRDWRQAFSNICNFSRKM